VDSDLLERLHEFARALEVADQLIGGVAAAFEELVEARAPQRARTDLLGELVAPAGEARGHREADADRVVHLVRYPGNESAERCELLRGDEVLLRLAQVLERLLRAIPRGAQFVLGLAFGNSVLAKHGNRACHFSDLVARLRSLNGLVVFLRYDGMHRSHDLLER